ncbi:MAG TPA: lamin tail domain-containing protein, partial [Saprospiraceae bacterium]|nr:lamin tail domain-containing protein [Saprospiraceae bacterium]
ISSCNQAYTLTITEIMYNPPESGIDSLEFIEITNTGNLPVDLENVYFSSGINHIFNSQIINPSESIVLVGNLQAINNTLANINVYSHVEWTQWYDGSLSNNGEKIILNDPNGNIIDSLTYEDKAPWPSILDGTDGNGSSIVLCDYQTDNSIGSNWKASTFSSCYNVNDHIYRASPMRNINCNYCYSLCTFVPDSILIGSPCDFNNGSGTIIDNCECVAINDMHLFFNDASGSVGDTIDYYLSISTFENIIGFDYSVLWNSSYIKFVALDNINTNIAGYDISNHSITDDRMNVSWSNGVPQSLPDSSTFYRMRFEVVTDRCVEDSIYLWHLPSENRINFYDSNMELLNVSKQDGVLNIYNLATLTMDYENNSIVELCYGETVNFNTATISDAKVYMECFNCSPDIDSTDFGGGDIIVQTIEPGSYSVVFFSNSTSCGRGDSIELNLVVSDPRFELEVPPSYCRGDSVEVTFIPQFLQSFENISIKNFEGEVFYEGVNLNPKFLPIGSDAYIYTAIDEYGCIYEESVDLFEVEPLDTPSITCSQTENKITFTWNDVGGTYDVNQISGPSGMLVGNTFVVENLMDGEEVTIELIVSDPNAICDDIIVPFFCTYDMDCPVANIDD